MELEVKIRNSGKVISPIIKAAHFTEQAGLPPTTKHAILSMVKLEQKDTVLFQIKEAFETLVANFAKEKETNTSLWGQNIHGRRESRKDDHDEMYEEHKRYEGRGRKHGRRNNRDVSPNTYREEEGRSRL